MTKKRKSKSKPRKRKATGAGARKRKRAPASAVSGSAGSQSELSALIRKHPRRAEIQKRAGVLRQPPVDAAAYESRREIVRRRLIGLGVPPPTADDICDQMQPLRYYHLEIWGYMVSRDDTVAEVLTHQATFVGTGLRLWARCVGYAHRADIEKVGITEIMPTAPGKAGTYPLWDAKTTVVSVDQKELVGRGHWSDWNQRRKIGRPKKGGGKMKAADREKYKRRNRAMDKRDRKLAARVKELEDQGKFLEADRLERRSKAARKRED